MWWVIIIETLAITVIGSLLHFTYEWSRQNKFVAIFSAVNESTWEHVKLALSGIFCCMLVDIFFLGDNQNYWLARSISFVVPVIVIPVFFYTYTRISRHAILPVDITCFVLAAFLSSLVFVSILGAPTINFWGSFLSMVVSTIIIAMYLLLTEFPLHNFLFEDPLTHEYGFEAHASHKVRRKARKM